MSKLCVSVYNCVLLQRFAVDVYLPNTISLFHFSFSTFVSNESSVWAGARNKITRWFSLLLNKMQLLLCVNDFLRSMVSNGILERWEQQIRFENERVKRFSPFWTWMTITYPGREKCQRREQKRPKGSMMFRSFEYIKRKHCERKYYYFNRVKINNLCIVAVNVTSMTEISVQRVCTMAKSNTYQLLKG